MDTQARRIIARFGSQKRLAELLGCGPTVVQGWADRGFIPAPRQGEIRRLARQHGIVLAETDWFPEEEKLTLPPRECPRCGLDLMADANRPSGSASKSEAA